ncbi:MAG: HK97 gp10 family phage protein [Clostridiales bacterium]|nr:HK97 gp10 family phage protein [Clostridiales bacterium]
MISMKMSDPNFRKTNAFLERMLNLIKMGRLDYYGRKGVEALKEATPTGETGVTKDSWYYKIERDPGVTRLVFCNSNVPEGGSVSVAILLQYGHAMRNGVFMQGIDYVNPAMKPIFENVSSWIVEEVKGT